MDEGPDQRRARFAQAQAILDPQWREWLDRYDRLYDEWHGQLLDTLARALVAGTLPVSLEELPRLLDDIREEWLDHINGHGYSGDTSVDILGDREVAGVELRKILSRVPRA